MSFKVVFLFNCLAMLVFSNSAIDGKYLLVQLEGGLEGRDGGADG